MAGETRFGPDPDGPRSFWEPDLRDAPEGPMRCWPVDDYDGIHAAPRAIPGFDEEGTYRWLKVPLLGQHVMGTGAKYPWDWCGRTAGSMVYNYHALLRGREAEYISHWVGPAEYGGYRDLRHHDGPRAFHMKPFDKTAGPVHGAVAGPGLELVYEARSSYRRAGIGPKYEKAKLIAKDELGKLDTPERTKRAAAEAADPEAMRRRFAPVIESIDRNNPCVFGTGTSKIGQHIIVISGYKWIRNQGAEEPSLWLRICNPASFGRLHYESAAVPWATPHVPPPPHINFQGVFLGRKKLGLGSIAWVRASRFFLPNTVTKKWPHDLLMDYDGGEGGGTFRLCKTETSPDDLAVSSTPSVFFPLTGFVRPQEVLRNSETSHGGYYGLDVTRLLHGGAHVRAEPEKGARATYAKAITSGFVVAARLMDDPGDETIRSPNFVLVRHELTLNEDPESAGKPLAFYLLYMHLAPLHPSTDSVGWFEMPWLRRLLQRGGRALVTHLADKKGYGVGERLVRIPGKETNAITANGLVVAAPKTSVEVEPEDVDLTGQFSRAGLPR